MINIKNIYKLMNHNKIIESIKRGINLALDDFDFNDNQENNQYLQNYNDIIDVNNEFIYVKNIIIPKLIKENKLKEFFYILVKNKDNFSKIQNFYRNLNISFQEAKLLIEYIDSFKPFYKEYIDLNLPSRTLWCTENLNIMDYEFKLNNNEYSAKNGSYYAWGNPNPNPLDIEGENLKRAKDYYLKELQKHQTDEIQLKLEDDGAYKEDIHYRTPTYDQFAELFENTNLIVLKLDEYTQHLGYILTSKINPFNFIWFPYEEGNNSILYLTSEIISNGPNKYYLDFVKLKQKEQVLEFANQPYQIWQNILIPQVLGKIRPIYKL